MDANKRRYQYQTRTGYTEGNTARKQELTDTYSMQKYNAAIERQRRQQAQPQPQRQAPQPQRQVASTTKTISSISKASMFVLTIAIVATLYFCIEFLMLQHEVTNMEKDIVKKEQQLISIRNENDAAYEQINMVYDLDYVYRVAVEELGMVYPNNNQIITFEKVEESYVRQYADIPD